jgi:hypothetical protein
VQALTLTRFHLTSEDLASLYQPLHLFFKKMVEEYVGLEPTN